MVRISDAEVVGVTESTVTVALAAEGSGDGVRLRVGDAVRELAPADGLQLITVGDLPPATELGLAVEDGAPDSSSLPRTVTTLPAPAAAQVASFATLNDLHFGERQFGGVPGVADDVLPATYTEIPYWQFMNDDAVGDINAAGVDAAMIKGDIADRGRADELALARATFDRLAMPWHAFLGNHDAYAGPDGLRAGYATLGQPPPPRTIELGGFRLLFVDTVDPGNHRGRLTGETLGWLDAELARSDAPAILLMHHQPVPADHARGLINAIGIPPADSAPLFELVARHRQVVAVLIGHTHRNRVRRYPQARGVPFAEVACTKDYPGAWAHYRLFADGTIRQEMRRISSPRALAHSRRCGAMFGGRYRDYASGALADRSWVT